MLDFSKHPFSTDPPQSSRPSPWFLLVSGVVDGALASVAGLPDAMLTAGFGVSTIAEIHSCQTEDIVAEFAGRGIVVQPEQIDLQLKTRKNGWSAADVFCLIVCWLRGLTAREIGERLNRKPSQIYSKRRRCGLPSRRKRSGGDLQSAAGGTQPKRARARRKRGPPTSEVTDSTPTTADPQALSLIPREARRSEPSGDIEAIDSFSHSLQPGPVEAASLIANADEALNGSQGAKVAPSNGDAPVLNAIARMNALIARFPEPPRRVPNYERDLKICARRLGGQNSDQIGRACGATTSAVVNALSKKGLGGLFCKGEEFDEARFAANMRMIEPAACAMRGTLFFRKKKEKTMFCRDAKKAPEGRGKAKKPSPAQPEQTPPPPETDERIKVSGSGRDKVSLSIGMKGFPEHQAEAFMSPSARRKRTPERRKECRDFYADCD